MKWQDNSMTKIKVLDCTLRDGGYINQWNFGEENIQKIIRNLENAHVDYIECGFLKQKIYNANESLFQSINQLEKFLDNKTSETKYSLMINYGEYPIEELPECKNNKILLRVAFHKQALQEAVIYCKQLIEKGYGIFLNPKQTNSYSLQEILELINRANELKPKALTIVDTNGAMKEDEVFKLFQLVDENLDKNIALCFHSHNNLQLSFANAKCLMEICTPRELIIDSSVLGMGRGAGNLCSELLIEYLNDIYGANYEIVPILKIIDEQIKPIFAKTPWGYSVQYFLSAANNCHPNYAKYFVENRIASAEFINNILQAIPEDKKNVYDYELIKHLSNLGKV